jgi:molybdate/tungstate transport system substrate-binding protein
MCKLLAQIVGLSVIAVMLLQPGSGISAERQPVSEVEGELKIIHAGSLAVPFRDVSALFNEYYPNVVVTAEAHGSRDCARKISDLGYAFDVMGSADYTVIDTLLIPDYADYSIRFATNEMAIAYTEHSRFRDEINADNWPEIMLREDVAFGRADPNRDPCGYRTVMVFQLAELFYGEDGLGEMLLGKDGQKYIRPKETDLLALLEAGEIDYLFIYRSVASQHGLSFVTLPDDVNLKSAKLADFYARAEVQLTGKEPGEFITKKGAPMVYGVTIPSNVEHRELAEAYVELLLSPEGQEIMQRNGQPSIVPAEVEHFAAVPDCLGGFCKPLENPDE